MTENMERVVYPECVYVYDERTTLCIIFVSILCAVLTVVGVTYQQIPKKIEARLQSSSGRDARSLPHRVALNSNADARYRIQKAAHRPAEVMPSAAPRV